MARIAALLTGAFVASLFDIFSRFRLLP